MHNSMKQRNLSNAGFAANNTNNGAWVSFIVSGGSWAHYGALC